MENDGYEFGKNRKTRKFERTDHHEVSHSAFFLLYKEEPEKHPA
jgi:hypothetical protein